MIKVLFIWQVREELRNYLLSNLSQYSQEVNLIFLDDVSNDNLLKHATDVDILVGWRPNKEFLLSSNNLKLFINPGAGVQHLIELFKEVNSLRSTKITLVNGHGNSYFTAQHVVALLLALTNKVIPHHNWMVEGKWRMRDTDAKSIPLRYRKIGLLGYGAVNSRVHKFLANFNVDFSVLRNSWSETVSYPTSIKKYTIAQLGEFLKEIDILIIAIPLTTYTEGLIGEKELELLGTEGLVVNIGRGPIIKEEELYLCLKNKIIRGAAIDVWYNYNPESDSQGRKFPSKFPFYELKSVILSPHRGASPMDDLERWNEVIENISRVIKGESRFLNEVDLKSGY